MSGRLWPLALSAVLALTVIANVLMLRVAADPNGSAVEPDYYRKALAWDRTLAQQAENRALGWTASARATAGGGVTLTLADAAGAPVTGARVHAVAIHNRLAAAPTSFALAARGPGEYAAPGVLARPGLWEIRVIAERGGERFTGDLRIEAGGGS
jgi:nitrogen fixation protein FixH